MNTCIAHDNAQPDQSPKQDVYANITAKIVAALEDGVRHLGQALERRTRPGRITRPLRHNGQPYTGINILSLWASASVRSFTAPIWMTCRQAVEFGAHVRKGEKGSPVYANSITRNETDSGVEVARDIHFLKGSISCSTSNRSKDCPRSTQRRGHRASTCPPASPARNAFSARPVPRSPTAATVPSTALN